MDTYATKEQLFTACERQTPAIIQTASPIVVRTTMYRYDRIGSNVRIPTHPVGNAFLMAMRNVAAGMMDNFPKCRLAYQHAGEINMLLMDGPDSRTGISAQELAAKSAAIATARFNREFPACLTRCSRTDDAPFSTDGPAMDILEKLRAEFEYMAAFTSVAFNVPVRDLPAYLTWRQQTVSDGVVKRVWRGLDKTARSDKAVFNVPFMRKRMHDDYGIDWDRLPEYATRGFTVYRRPDDGLVLNTAPPVFDEDPLHLASLLCAGLPTYKTCTLDMLNEAMDLDRVNADPFNIGTAELHVLYTKYTDVAAGYADPSADHHARAIWADAEYQRAKYRKELARRGILVP